MNDFLIQTNFIEKSYEFSVEHNKVKLSGNKYNGEQYFFQKYSTFLMTSV